MMLPVTDTMSLPLTLSSSFYWRVKKLSGETLIVRLTRRFFFEFGAVFNFLDLFPFRAFFG